MNLLAWCVKFGKIINHKQLSLIIFVYNNT